MNQTMLGLLRRPLRLRIHVPGLSVSTHWMIPPRENSVKVRLCVCMCVRYIHLQTNQQDVFDSVLTILEFTTVVKSLCPVMYATRLSLPVRHFGWIEI